MKAYLWITCFISQIYFTHLAVKCNPPDVASYPITISFFYFQLVRSEEQSMEQQGDIGRAAHECAVCGRAFTQKASLTKHLLTHTGEKEHQCAVCGKAFGQKGSLTRHLPTHTGVKVHMCTLCSKAFTRKEHLTSHLLTHSGEKPQKCNV